MQARPAQGRRGRRARRSAPWSSAATRCWPSTARSSASPPARPDAIARWQQMRGRSGVLHTGHCVIDTHREVWLARSAATQVRFAHVTDEEIEAYVATGEPLSGRRRLHPRRARRRLRVRRHRRPPQRGRHQPAAAAPDVRRARLRLDRLLGPGSARAEPARHPAVGAVPLEDDSDGTPRTGTACRSPAPTTLAETLSAERGVPVEHVAGQPQARHRDHERGQVDHRVVQRPATGPGGPPVLEGEATAAVEADRHADARWPGTTTVSGHLFSGARAAAARRRRGRRC